MGNNVKLTKRNEQEHRFRQDYCATNSEKPNSRQEEPMLSELPLKVCTQIPLHPSKAATTHTSSSTHGSILQIILCLFVNSTQYCMIWSRSMIAHVSNQWKSRQGQIQCKVGSFPWGVFSWRQISITRKKHLLSFHQDVHACTRRISWHQGKRLQEIHPLGIQ